MLKAVRFLAVAGLALVLCGTASAQMKISSPAFAAGGSIPAKYTCDAQNPPNPPLSFTGVPATAKSLVLILEDPDVPKTMIPSGIFVHWIVPDIAISSKGFAEGQGPAGMNGTGKPGYIGPCPPDREHRYFFTLYALDQPAVGGAKFTDRASFETALKGHVIARAEYMGKYEKAKK
jgi:Raf kinase inhibitor-like YbhB/YbcL family protein